MVFMKTTVNLHDDGTLVNRMSNDTQRRGVALERAPIARVALACEGSTEITKRVN